MGWEGGGSGNLAFNTLPPHAILSDRRSGQHKRGEGRQKQFDFCTTSIHQELGTSTYLPSGRLRAAVLYTD